MKMLKRSRITLKASVTDAKGVEAQSLQVKRVQGWVFLLSKQEENMISHPQAVQERLLHAVGFTVAFGIIAVAAGMFWAVEKHILV